MYVFYDALFILLLLYFIRGIVDCDWDSALLSRFAVVATCEVPVIELMLFLTNSKQLPVRWM